MYGFTGHKVRKNHLSALPTRMMFYDSETKHSTVGDEQRHILDLGWLCYCEKEHTGKAKIEKKFFIDSADRFNSLIDKYCKPQTTLYLFAHNAFFDLQVSSFYKYFTKAGWTLDFYYDKDLTYILSISKEKRHIKCISSTNYFSVPLKELGKLIGREKIEIDLETAPRDEKIEYCYNDMLILKEGMEYYFAFLKKHDMGKFGMTKSSQAFNVFRHRFMSVNIFIHQEENIIELERAAYHGGRTECFRIGKVDGGPFVCLDVNSMYPYIMKIQSLPTMLIDYGGGVSVDSISKMLSTYAVIVKARVNTDKPIYGIKNNGKLIYPIGQFDCHLTTPGLKKAISEGHLIKIIQYALYEKQEIFANYVDYFYTLRQQYKNEGNEIYQELCKLFGNTLYGKFGQKFEKIEYSEQITFDGYWRLETIDMASFERETYTKMFNMLVMKRGEENGRDSLVAIPAHITEYGRLMLWDIMEQIGRENVAYCDTDSVIFSKSCLGKVKDRLSDKALGKLKIEYETDNLVIHGPKDYSTDHFSKIKGIPRTAEKIAPDTFKYSQFLGQASHLRQQIWDYVIVREVVKQNKRIYDKGNVSEKGIVTPFVLDDV